MKSLASIGQRGLSKALLLSSSSVALRPVDVGLAIMRELYDGRPILAGRNFA